MLVFGLGLIGEYFDDSGGGRRHDHVGWDYNSDHDNGNLGTDCRPVNKPRHHDSLHRQHDRAFHRPADNCRPDDAPPSHAPPSHAAANYDATSDFTNRHLLSHLQRGNLL